MRARSWLAIPAPILLLLFAGGCLSAAITERVSVSNAGEEGNGNSSLSAVSSDGRFVAFCSSASNLVPGDTNCRCRGPMRPL